MIKVDLSSEDITNEQSQKIIMGNKAKHSQQGALIENKNSATADSSKELKRKKSKSDLEKVKRESDKLLWRDDHLNNPSAA